MADEKKPKIDLKARLGKAAPAPTPAPAPVAAPAAVPVATRSRPPPPQVTPSGVPIPPAPSSVPGLPGGVPVPASPFAAGRAPNLDPSNPLAAAVAPAYRAPAPRPAEPQRIEVDEMGIQQAAKSARRQGIIIGSVFAVILAGVGFVAGGAQEKASGRDKAKADAVELAANVGKAKDLLKSLAEKMDAGKISLIKSHKYPDELAKQLGSINVDFDGTQLAGRRFSGFSTATTQDLIEFVTAVQGVNDRKLIIQGLLTKLQTPIKEQLKIPEGEIRINYVVAVDKDPAGNVAAFLSHLAEPIAVAGQAVTLPKEFTFANPGGGSGNTQLPPYKGGDLANKPAAMYVVPKTFDTVCPSAVGGQIVQLGAQISGFVHDINGEGPPDPNTVSDAKPGLLERADKLIKELGTVN